MTSSVLSTDDLTVVLGAVPVVRRVSLAVRPGEFVALLGANGSGKSTLVKATLGLLPLRRGEVRLFDTPLGHFRDWKRVGYVPQRSSVSTQQASVREVVASGRLARRRPFALPGRGERAQVDAALTRVDLLDRAGRATTTLSGGQQQRALVARALVGDPELLVMDEPFAGVDHANQRAIADAVGTAVAGGAAALVVLHELGPFEQLIDRVVVMSDGLVVHDGPPDEGHRTAGHEHTHPETRRWFHGTFEAPHESEDR